jgi:hypothetical protein
MKQVARGLAGYGRNGDNNLVHVSNEELRGIEQLTGRKFTRNPDTGLPEAFNFGDAIKMALPVIAGITATALTGGAAAPLALAAGAGASGLTSAGIAKAEGKSTEEALTKGLISGVTSYAGGQLMAGVGDAVAPVAAEGAKGAAQAATQGAGSGIADAASAGIPNMASAIPSGGAQAASAAASAMPPVDSIGQALQSANLQSGYNPATQAIGTPASSMVKVATPNIGFGERVSNIVDNPGAAISQVGRNIYKNPVPAGIAALGTYASMSDMGGNQASLPGTDPYDPNKYPEQFPTSPRRFNAPPAGYMAGRDPEYRYFAKGGLASMRSEGGMTENVVNEAKAALLGEHPKPQDAISRFEGMFGSGALEVLRDRITGGRVRGAGGGMDDLIPGTIEGRQKVRLADGEFVLPSHIVSAIGDGSTDQGVRRLHEMMDSIYKQKYKSDDLPKRLKKGTLIDER